MAEQRNQPTVLRTSPKGSKGRLGGAENANKIVEGGLRTENEKLKAAAIIESLDDEGCLELLEEIGDLLHYEKGPMLRVTLMKSDGVYEEGDIMDLVANGEDCEAPLDMKVKTD